MGAFCRYNDLKLVNKLKELVLISVELATAYLTILPETSKLAAGVKKGLSGVETQASKDLNTALKGGISSGIKSGAKEGSTSVKRAAQTAGKTFEKEVSDGLSDGGKKGFSGLAKTAKGSAAKAGGAFKKGFNKATSGIGGAMVTAAATVGVGAAFNSIITASSDAQQSIGATETVFGDMASTIMKKSKEAAQAVGLSGNAYRENANLIGSLFMNKGLKGNELVKQTDLAITKAADLSATFGGSTEEALDALSAAYKGEFDQLERYGISIKQSTINTEANALAQKKYGQELKDLAPAQQDAINRQATTNLVNKQSAKTNGAFAKETGTLAHQQQVLGAQFDNLKTKIGEKLLPILTRLFRWVNDKLPAATAALRTGFNKVQPVIEGVGTAVKNTVGFLMDNKGILVALVAGFVAYRAAVAVSAAVTAYQAVAARAAAANMSLLNFALRANPIGLVITALTLLGAGLIVAYKKSETFRRIVQGAWAGIKTGLSAAWGVIKPIFSGIGRWLGVFLPKAFTVVKTVFKVAFGVIRFYITKIWWPVVKGIFAAIKFYVTKVLAPVFRFLWNKVVKPIFGSIGSKIKAVWNNVIKPVFSAFGGFIKNNVLPAFRSGVDKVAGIWEGLKSKIGKPINFVIGTLYNNGLRKAMNLIPGVNLKEAPSVKFAKGGVMPGYTPGRDVHHFTSPTGGRLALSGGEAIMRPEFTRAVGGPRGVEALNRMARKGTGSRFAKGGVYWPVPGRQTSTYAGHDGVDINRGSGWTDYGDPIRAAADGRVSYAGAGRGYGNAVFTSGPYGTLVYGHMSRMLVRTGQKVTGGQQIGAVGNTGNSSAPHLHFGFPGGTTAQALAFLSGAKVTGGGMAGTKGPEQTGFLDAIRQMPGKLKGIWSNIKSMTTGSPWAQQFAGTGKSLVKSGAKYADDKIPNRLLPDNPLQGILKKMGVYDNGGILEPGGFAYNASNKPEAVFNQRQFAKYADGSSNGPRELVLTGKLDINWKTGEATMRGIARDEISGDKKFEDSRRRMNR